MRDCSVRRLSRLHAALYRATGGRVGRRLVDNDMLLLTTRGAVTGRAHTVPLLYLRDGESLVVIASYGGRPHHPQWYHNLLADPRATVRLRSLRIPVDAHTIEGDERDEWWNRVVAAYDGYADYQSRTNRQIPIVRLQRV